MIHYGRDLSGRIAATNVLERLWLNSTGDSDDECWTCNLKGSKAGHVRIRLDDKSRMMIHRLAYEAYYAEPVPENLQVNHHCDNPKCFNPKHLYLGTQKDNMIDRFKRDRANLKRKIPKSKIEYIINSSKSLNELAEEFSVTPEAIAYHRKKAKGQGIGQSTFQPKAECLSQHFQLKSDAHTNHGHHNYTMG